MLNIAKYATVPTVAVCLGVAATNQALAWDYGYRHGYGPYAYHFAYPNHSFYGYRPSYRYNGHGTFYPPGTGG